MEAFVDADTAAKFLGVTRDFLLKLARNGDIPAHAITNGNQRLRRTWRFRLSELNAHMEQK